MASFSTPSDVDLHSQVAALSRELDALKKAVASRGSVYFEDGRDVVSDYYSEIAERLGDALPAIRQRGRAIERTARNHPVTSAAMGLVVLGLLAGLLLNRR